MPSRRPEHYQLALDFELRPEASSSLVYRSDGPIFGDSDTREPGLGRFVRVVKETVVVRSPIDAATYLQERVFSPFGDFTQEELWVLLLNAKNRITHDAMVYRGLIDQVPIRIAEVYREPIKVNARYVILSHCHPSGDPTPSPEDVAVTSSVLQVGRLLGIELLDHIIIGQGCWVSLKERGLGFSAIAI